jgi:hypothetical protein
MYLIKLSFILHVFYLHFAIFMDIHTFVSSKPEILSQFFCKRRTYNLLAPSCLVHGSCSFLARLTLQPWIWRQCGSSETSVDWYRTTHRYVPEDRTLPITVILCCKEILRYIEKLNPYQYQMIFPVYHIVTICRYQLTSLKCTDITVTPATDNIGQSLNLI